MLFHAPLGRSWQTQQPQCLVGKILPIRDCYMAAATSPTQLWRLGGGDVLWVCLQQYFKLEPEGRPQPASGVAVSIKGRMAE